MWPAWRRTAILGGAYHASAIKAGLPHHFRYCAGFRMPASMSEAPVGPCPRADLGVVDAPCSIGVVQMVATPGEPGAIAAQLGVNSCGRRSALEPFGWRDALRSGSIISIWRRWWHRSRPYFRAKDWIYVPGNP